MEFFTLYTIPPLLSSILFLFLGVVVYWNNRKSLANITFLLLCFATSWWQFSWFILFNAQNEILANYLVKIGHIGIIFIPIFFFHFLLSFLREISKFDRHLLYFSYSMGLIFEAVLLTTNYFINGFYEYFWGFYPKAGFLHPFYLLLLSVLTVRALYLLFSFLKKNKRTHPIKYHQAKYILLALIFYIFASSDFLVNYGVEFYPSGFLFILLFLGITAYAIVKHYLFGIKVILTELLVAVIGVILLFQALISEGIWNQVLSWSIFVLFGISGYYLIKATIKEIERREQIEKMDKELRKTYKELKKLDIAKSEFISIASHQLRTPLTAIKGYVSLISDKAYGVVSPKMKRPLTNVYGSVERLIKLVNDLLSISRIEAGKIKVEPEEFFLEDLINNILEELGNLAKAKKLYLEWEKSKKPLVKVFLDKAKIRQVVLNIIDNAIKYTQTGGITISCKRKNGLCRIEIKDTGEGMTRVEISRLFKTFSRGAAGKRTWTEGAGLGLYVAKQFTEMHNGRIWVESTGKQKGSTFYVELPIKYEEKT
jgi:signal transduction histidine kinase